MILRKKIRDEEFTSFYRQMGMLSASGMSLTESLSAISDERDKTPSGRLYAVMKAEINAGAKAEDVFAKHLPHFNNFPKSIFQQDTRKISGLFKEMAEQYEKLGELRKMNTGLGGYILSIGVVAVVITMGLLIFVIPIFAQMFADFGKSLPAPTRFLITVSNLINNWFLLIIALLAGSVYIFRKNRVLKYAVLDKIPVVNHLQRTISNAEFFGILSFLYKLNLPINTSLHSAASSINNDFISEKLKKTIAEVSDNKQFAVWMRESGLFPQAVVNTVNAGERADRMEDAMAEGAVFLMKEASSLYVRRMPFFHYFTMMGMGLIVGYIVISMYLPIFSLAGAAG